jgi:hypothetical protein
VSLLAPLTPSPLQNARANGRDAPEKERGWFGRWRWDWRPDKSKLCLQWRSVQPNNLSPIVDPEDLSIERVRKIDVDLIECSFPATEKPVHLARLILEPPTNDPPIINTRRKSLTRTRHIELNERTSTI